LAREATYRDLIAWRKGVQLVSDIYRETAGWPPDERFGITSQARRAAMSIPANIAEGQGRFGKAELRRHLFIAHGSLCELETLLVVANDIGLLPGERHDRLMAQTDEVGRIMRGLLRSLEGDRPRDS
jgi:four helix bundle protein